MSSSVGLEPEDMPPLEGGLAMAQTIPVSLTVNGTAHAATPAFTPPGGNYTTAQSVTITDATPGAGIYYTIDGTTPTTASKGWSKVI